MTPYPTIRIKAPSDYPEGVSVHYEIEHGGGASFRLNRWVRGSLPVHFWDDAAHVHYQEDGSIKQLICMHGGSMHDCIDKADEHLQELYAEDDEAWRLVKRKKRDRPMPITLSKRSFWVYGAASASGASAAAY